MSDQTPTPAVDPAVAKLVTDLTDAVALVRSAVPDIKAKGVSGALPYVEKAVPMVTKDIADITAAIPSIKAGYKTSEFWMGVIGMAVIAAFPLFGKPVPVDAAVVIGAIVTIYTTVRGLIKVKAPAAAAVPAK